MTKEKIDEDTHDQKYFRWCSSTISRRLLGLALVMNPSVSCESASKSHVLILFSFSHQMGFSVDTKSLTPMTPGRSVLKKCLSNVGSETLLALWKKLRNQKLFCANDAASKGGCHHMVKNIAWFDVLQFEFDCEVLDSNTCDGTDLDAVRSLDFSFKKLIQLMDQRLNFTAKTWMPVVEALVKD